jgi:hypothetical protein
MHLGCGWKHLKNMNTMYILNKDHAIRKSRGTHGLDEI